MRKLRNLHVYAASLLSGAMIAGCAVVDDDVSGAVESSRAPLLGMGQPDVIPDQFIVVFKQDVQAASVSAASNRVALRGDESRIQRSYSVIPGFSARLSPEAVEALQKNPEVAYIEADRRIQINTVYESLPDGLDRTDQRALPRDGQYDDHDNAGAGVNVYIVDTGIRTTHEEFTGRIGSTADFVGDGGTGEDCNGHGTHVASTAAGTLYGMAKAATLHAVRVLDCGGSGSYAGVIAGIDHVRNDCATRSGPCVANMSLGGGFSQSLNDAVDAAVAAGVSFAVAAGNDSADACSTSPASTPSAITVGAADDNDAAASFTNTGGCVDVFAPGVSILGADIDSDSDTQSISGTSMASPHVAGAIAQFLGANPAATPADVEAALKGSATPGCVNGLDPFTPNLLLFNNFSESGEGQGCGLGDPNSCEGFCGRQAPGGCFCDKQCKRFGDCCDDKVELCGR